MKANSKTKFLVIRPATVVTASPLLAVLAFSSVSADGAITMVNTGSSVRNGGSGGQSFSVNFDAGATANAIIVSLSSESTASAGQVAITYGGFPLTAAIDHNSSQPSIWYLNLSSTTYMGGTDTLVLDFTNVGSANGYGLGFVSVNTGDALRKDLAVHATNTTSSPVGDPSGLTVGLTTTLESFVVAGHRSNSGSGGASASAPMTQLFGAQIGSSQGAGGYQASVAAGTPSFTFVSGNQIRNSSAAAFVAVPEPSTALLGGLGFLVLLRRRTRC